VLDYNLELQYGLQRERRSQLLKKIYEGEEFTMVELREALENDYFDDSLRFRPIDSNGLPQKVDPVDSLSHDDLR